MYNILGEIKKENRTYQTPEIKCKIKIDILCYLALYRYHSVPVSVDKKI